MESIKQSLFINLGETERKIPAIGARVSLVGERGEFMVIRVDKTRHVADLIRMTGIRRIESGVPLYALRPIEDQQSAERSMVDLPPPELQTQE